MCLLASLKGNVMNEVVAMTEKRKAVDVYDELSLKLGHIAALLGVMAACDKGECDVNTAAYGLEYMVDDAKVLSDELYHS